MSKRTCRKAHHPKAGANKKQPLKQDVVHMQVIRPNAAGIDIWRYPACSSSIAWQGQGTGKNFCNIYLQLAGNCTVLKAVFH